MAKKQVVRRSKKRHLDFDSVLLLLMLTVGSMSALGGFLFGRRAMQEVTPLPIRRVLKPSQLEKPRKVNLAPFKPFLANQEPWV